MELGSAHSPAGDVPRPKMAPGRCLSGDGGAAGAWGRAGAKIGARTGLPAPAPTPAAARRTGAASVCAVVRPREPAAASAAPGPAPAPGPAGAVCARGESGARGRGPQRLGKKGWGRGPRRPRPRALMKCRLGSPRRGGAHLENANAIGKSRANRQNFY